MGRINRGNAALAAALFTGVLGTTGHSQSPYPYLRGQNVVPVYEGWERNSDGTFTMSFGYMNRNYEEALNIPVGPSNNVDAGGPDRGQPTYFYPRRQQFVYRVQVPKDWDKKDLVWTIASAGKVEKAYGSLAAIYEIDRELVVKNLGRAAANLDVVNRDQPPAVTVQAPKSVAIGDAATLGAVVTDDGIPPPRPARPDTGRAAPPPLVNAPVPEPPRPPRGLWLVWQQYRGPGTVTFEPDGYTTVTSGAATTATVRFSEPGTYVLRALASDSLLDAVQDTTVTVTGAANPSSP
jgi:hypothetical protein